MGIFDDPFAPAKEILREAREREGREQRQRSPRVRPSEWVRGPRQGSHHGTPLTDAQRERWMRQPGHKVEI